MHIEKRGQDSWRITLRHQGQRFRRTVRAATKSEAARLGHLFAVEVSTEATRYQQGRHTLGEALERWTQEDAPASAADFIRVVWHRLGHLYLDELPEAATRYAMDLRAAGRAPSTINNHLHPILRTLRLAYERWQWLDKPLHQRIKRLSTRGNERHIYLRPRDVEALLAEIPREDMRLFFTVLVYSGLRWKSELLPLARSAVVDDAIQVVQPKTKTVKRVPVAPEMAVALREALPWQFTVWQVRLAWDKARGALRRPEWHIHDLRHTFAAWLANSGQADLLMVKELLGHASLRATGRYLHLFDERARIAVAALPRLGPIGDKTG